MVSKVDLIAEFENTAELQYDDDVPRVNRVFGRADLVLQLRNNAVHLSSESRIDEGGE